jgi:predicted nucleotidyltransferase component of viral defense system
VPYDVTLTIAKIIRHAPAHRQGREAALVDIAQDLILRHLQDVGVLDQLVFKGGTALRKPYAGKEGRFSLDLDFSVRNIGDDAETIVDLLTEDVDGLRIGPFTYGTTNRRGKRTLTIDTTLGPTGQLTSKLDVNPPPWLEPISRAWVPMPIHDAYGGPLPCLSSIRIEENIAEKVARLNRATTARDVYDLVWIWRNYRHQNGVNLDPALIRRLTVLKIWVDAFGLEASGTRWKPGHEAAPFDPTTWLRTRPAKEFDREDIGELSVPAPDLDDLGSDLVSGYSFLADLDPDETMVASLSGAHRPLVLSMLAALPGRRLLPGSCW